MAGESKIVTGTRPPQKSQTEKRARGNKDSGKDLFRIMNMSVSSRR